MFFNPLPSPELSNYTYPDTTFTFPLPGHIAQIISENSPKIAENLHATCVVVFAGLGIGCVPGYGISVATH
jgi:ABC-type nitrate/sulfonate/bicarbonate transport system permease component